jgi:excisionase family DNA binding protein
LYAKTNLLQIYCMPRRTNLSRVATKKVRWYNLKRILCGEPNLLLESQMPQRVKDNRIFLSTSEACQKTGLSPTYIQRLLRNERLEGFKAGSSWFVYEDSLLSFTTQPRKRGPKGPHKKLQKSSPTTSLNREDSNEEKQKPTKT